MSTIERPVPSHQAIGTVLNGSTIAKVTIRVETWTCNTIKEEVYYDVTGREIGHRRISCDLHFPKGWHGGTW